MADILPAGVSFVSSSASTGTFASNVWNFSVGEDSEGYVSHVPATLTIVTTAQSIGTIMNQANLESYYCDGKCSYHDANSTNDSDVAYVVVQSAPQVLGDSTTATPPAQVLGATTLADTGSGLFASALAALFTLTAIAVTTRRKKTTL